MSRNRIAATVAGERGPMQSVGTGDGGGEEMAAGKQEFRFARDGQSWVVWRRGRRLGRIVSMLEPGGRYCFRLACDVRRRPRTYRGRRRAADALWWIDKIKREARRRNLSLDALIVLAWDWKPSSSDR